MENKKPIITWLILVYDGNAEKRFPFKRQWHYFDYARATQEQIDAVIAICKPKSHINPANVSPRIGDINYTFSTGISTGTNPAILQYRNLFTYIAEDQLGSLYENEAWTAQYNVSLNNYFEDENGQKITSVQYMNREAERIHGPGAMFSLVGNLESVLQFGNPSINNSEQWTQEDSDQIAHMIQTSNQIIGSKWFQTPVRITLQKNSLLDHDWPNLEDFIFASVYFRQLLKNGDGLVGKSVRTYSKFSASDISVNWIHNENKTLNRICSREDPMLPGYKIEDIFNAYLYGAGLMHSVSPKNKIQRDLFSELLKRYPKHTILFTLNSSLKLMMNHIQNISQLIHRHYADWLHRYNLPRPDIHWHQSLFNLPNDNVNTTNPTDPDIK